MVIVLTGPMGSGKTTIGQMLASRLGWRFEDGDDYHPQANIDKMRSGQPLNDQDREPWLSILSVLICKGKAEDQSFVLACSALKRKYRAALGIDQMSVISVYLKGSTELLNKRVENRTHQYMAKGLLQSQLSSLEEPQSGLVINVDDSPENIVERIASAIGNNGRY